MAPLSSFPNKRSIMKIVVLCLACAFASVVDAFVTPNKSPTCAGVLFMGYVPDGMSPEQYKKLKQKEQQAKSAKKFGAFGPQTFKSRSMASFQKDLESGKADHLMPMFNAKEKLSKGKIKKEDIPYMQRGGNWDNSDVKGAKKKSWNKFDQEYQQNERPMGVDWMGLNQRRGGPTASQNAKKETPKKKGWFG